MFIEEFLIRRPFIFNKKYNKTDSWYSAKEIQQIFRNDLGEKFQEEILIAEQRGEIPPSQKIIRGKKKHAIDCWSNRQLTKIGKRFGFLSQPVVSPEIITIFTQKGGTLKSTITYELGRIFAINGMRVIIIGLDTQESVTNMALDNTNINTLEELRRMKQELGGLFHFLYQKNVDLSDVVKKTDLPTLDVIPETGELAELERRLQVSNIHNSVFTTRLMPAIREYDVVIFDNSPSWNQLVMNSLYCADTVISPIGCDIGTIDVIDNNLETIREFHYHHYSNWRNFLMIPTLIDNSRISQQIYGSYISSYPDSIIYHPVRRTSDGQEATYFKKSILEYKTDSLLANDYYKIATAVWKNIIFSQKRSLCMHGVIK